MSNQADDNSEVDTFCKKIIDHPTHIKTQSFDVYTVFRFITSKKNKLGDLPYYKIDQDKLNFALQNKELKDFVKRVNPFYNWKDEDKNHFYVLNFIVAGLLQQRINKIITTRNEPHSFIFYDPEKSVYMTHEDLDIKDDTKEAYFDSLKEAISVAENYLTAYAFLGIHKSIELHTLNMDKQIIVKQEFGSTTNSEDYMFE